MSVEEGLGQVTTAFTKGARRVEVKSYCRMLQMQTTEADEIRSRENADSQWKSVRVASCALAS